MISSGSNFERETRPPAGAAEIGPSAEISAAPTIIEAKRELARFVFAVERVTGMAVGDVSEQSDQGVRLAILVFVEPGARADLERGNAIPTSFWSYPVSIIEGEGIRLVRCRCCP